jgi:hypothetical protein
MHIFPTLLFSTLLTTALASPAPLWDLATHDPALTTGTVQKVDGRVALPDGSAFAVPAEAFPDPRNFVVQMTFSVPVLSARSQFTFMHKQTAGDDGFDYSLNLHRDEPGSYSLDSSVNKILLSTWRPLGPKGLAVEQPLHVTLAVRNGLATFYAGLKPDQQKPVKTGLMELVPNREPMWVGRNANPRLHRLSGTVHALRVYGPDFPFVSAIEENSPRRVFGGAGWAVDAPKQLLYADWAKVLIYGDSISGQYGPMLEPFLNEHRAYFFHYVGFVGGDVPTRAIAEAAASFPFDFIVFNNGLHSLHWTPQAVPDEVVKDRMRKIAQSFRQGAPKAKLFYLSTTPHTAPSPAPGQPVTALGDRNHVVIRLNTLTAAVMKEEGIDWIDVYTPLAARLDLAAGDKYHWKPEGGRLITDTVADHLRPHLQKGP